MRLKEKIEEIRSKPEHVRMRYVWGALATSMFFIFIIWLFSMMSLFKKSSPEISTPDLTPIKSSINDLKNNASSLKDISNEISNTDKNMPTQTNLPSNKQDSDSMIDEELPFDSVSN